MQSILNLLNRSTYVFHNQSTQMYMNICSYESLFKNCLETEGPRFIRWFRRYKYITFWILFELFKFESIKSKYIKLMRPIYLLIIKKHNLSRIFNYPKLSTTDELTSSMIERCLLKPIRHWRSIFHSINSIFVWNLQPLMGYIPIAASVVVVYTLVKYCNWNFHLNNRLRLAIDVLYTRVNSQRRHTWQFIPPLKISLRL